MLLLDMPHAATVSYLLLPFEFVFWIGFALPFGPPLGIARTILLLLARRPAAPSSRLARLRTLRRPSTWPNRSTRAPEPSAATLDGMTARWSDPHRLAAPPVN
jgi:hypothetical protein